ncbi:MAG: translation initiation factor IF-2 N-terminal domain-containing protein, partial [Acidimicrobiia bacterium]|nr:translation initiation factor IF-2 N-terminal domain-containing protein [Acidimicrobiia bacterium]
MPDAASCRSRFTKGLRGPLPQKIRLYELARELGLANQDVLDLCDTLGIGVKSHSSSVVEAQADRVRRRAQRDGLVRSPEERAAEEARAEAEQASAQRADGDAEARAEAEAREKAAADAAQAEAERAKVAEAERAAAEKAQAEQARAREAVEAERLRL